MSEDGRALPTVIRVNTFLTGIYPQIIQSAVFSKKALIHTVLHLLKLIPPLSLIYQGNFITGFGALNSVRGYLENDFRPYSDK